MKTVKVILVFIVCVVFSSNAFAQPPTPDNCWSGDPCTDAWIYENHNFNSEDGGIGLAGKVAYYWRDCNGVIEIIIDWDNTTLVDPGFFTHGSYEEIDFDGAMEYMKSHILEDVIYDSGVTIPDCINGTKKFINIYTARCGVWVKCSYKVDTEAEIMKDDGYVGNCPLPYSHNGVPYIDVWKWQSCGEICCKKSYELCREYSPISGDSVIRIKNVSTGAAPGEQCSDQGVFKDWKTGVPYPCKDGCSGSGN